MALLMLSLELLAKDRTEPEIAEPWVEIVEPLARLIWLPVIVPGLFEKLIVLFVPRCIESLVSMPDWKLILALAAMRQLVTLSVPLLLEREALMATLSLLNVKLLKFVDVLIRSVSLLSVVVLLKLNPEVIFTVPPLKVQPLQVPLELM